MGEWAISPCALSPGIKDAWRRVSPLLNGFGRSRAAWFGTALSLSLLFVLAFGLGIWLCLVS